MKQLGGFIPMLGYGLMKGLNKLLNPKHNWLDYNSIENQYTRAGLTGAEREANAFSAEEAQKSRDFTQYMAQNKYQMETDSMEQAGLNPAMVYGGGTLVPTASNGATASSVSPQGAGIGSAFDMITQMMRFPKELELLDEQIKNTKADTGKKGAETSEIGARIDNFVEQLKGLQLDNEAKGIINSYLDQQERADLAVKNATIDEKRASIDNIYAAIDKMDAEKREIFVRCCEAVANINLLQAKTNLTNEEARKVQHDIAYLDAQTKILGLTAQDWDYINVLGSQSMNIGVGPFKGGSTQIVTLDDLKNRAKGDDKDDKKSDKESWSDMRKKAEERYGALE